MSVENTMNYSYSIFPTRVKVLCCGILALMFIWVSHSVGQEMTGRWELVGLDGKTISSLCPHPNYIFVGTSRNFVWRLNSSNLDSLPVPDDSIINFKKISDIACDGENRVYAATREGFVVSVDTGATWLIFNRTSVGGSSEVVDQLLSVAFDPSLPKRVFIGDDFGTVFKDENTGSDWDTCGTHPGFPISSLLVPSNSSNNIFSGSSVGVYKNSFSCGEWTEFNDGLPNASVRSLTQDNGSANVIYAGTNVGIYRRSLDSGPWEFVGLDTLTVRDLIIHPLNNEIMFAATHAGVFKTVNSGLEWHGINNELVFDDVRALAVPPRNSRILYAGTKNGGLLSYLNSPPNTPLLQSPTDSFLTKNAAVSLTWAVPDDFEKDALHFIVDIATDVSFENAASFSTEAGDSGFSAPGPFSEEVTEVSFQFSLGESFPNDGSYFWRVTAWDGIDSSATSEVRRFTIDTQRPVVVDFPEEIKTGRANEIRLSPQITDVTSGVRQAILFYRKGGETEFQSDTLSSSQDGRYPFTITGEFVDERGLAYYLKAEDIAGNVITLPDDTGQPFYAVEVNIAENSLQLPNALKAKTYRLISMPINLSKPGVNAVLQERLGFYDKAKYRVVDYKNGAYVDFEEDDSFAFAPGKAYWLIVRDEGKTITIGDGTSLRVNETFKLNLQQGWNLIGNPFSFPISREQLQLENSKKILTIENEDNLVDQNNGRQFTFLEPWAGYFLYAKEPTRLILAPDKAFIEPPTNQETLRTIKWSIRIVAKNDQAVDSYNYVGAIDTASSRADKINAYEIPSIEKTVSIYFTTEDKDHDSPFLTTDYRNVKQKGSYWDFVLSAPRTELPTTLSFEGIDSVPDEYDVQLIDPELSTSYDLRQQSEVTFQPSGDELFKELRLIVGEPEVVSENNFNVNQRPNQFALLQNHPNPFNPTTSIRYLLPEQTTISLTIYNVLGKKVATLIKNEPRKAGIFTVKWNSEDNSGIPVPSGVYFYSLVSDSFKQVKKMILVR